jgi:hypothetical protein
MGKSAHIRARRRRRARLSGRLAEELTARREVRDARKQDSSAAFGFKKYTRETAEAAALRLYPIVKRAPR